MSYPPCTMHVRVGGWHASTENTSKVECYNPRTDQWVQKSPLLERRYRPGVTVVSGKVYVLGGEEGWDRSVIYKTHYSKFCHWLVNVTVLNKSECMYRQLRN